MRRQHGVALFTAIFLIAVVAVVGTAVALISTTQQVSSARELDATRAYYIARARLDREIANVTTGGSCDMTTKSIKGFTTAVEKCSGQSISERGSTYHVYTIRVAAYRGDRTAGTLVRRELRAVVTGP